MNLNDAVLLCKQLYAELSPIGYYPALTGGALYKEGNRKDIDIIIYRNRQKIDSFEMKDIESKLMAAGLVNFQYFGFVTKCNFGKICVDLFNPETRELTEEEYEELVKTKPIERKIYELK